MNVSPPHDVHHHGDSDDGNAPSMKADKGSPASTKDFGTPLSKASTIYDFAEYQNKKASQGMDMPMGSRPDMPKTLEDSFSPSPVTPAKVHPGEESMKVSPASPHTPRPKGAPKKAAKEELGTPKTPTVTTRARTPQAPKAMKKKTNSLPAVVCDVISKDGLPRGYHVDGPVECADDESDEEQPLLLRLLRRKAAIAIEYMDYVDYNRSFGKNIQVHSKQVYERSEMENHGWVKKGGIYRKPNQDPPSVTELKKWEKAQKSRPSPMKKAPTPKASKTAKSSKTQTLKKPARASLKKGANSSMKKITVMKAHIKKKGNK